MDISVRTPCAELVRELVEVMPMESIKIGNLTGIPGETSKEIFVMYK